MISLAFFGGGLRVDTTLQLGNRALAFAKEKGANLLLTGHSLGGSVASAVGGQLDIFVVTFNAPELRHSFSNAYEQGRIKNSEQSFHYYLDGDIISRIGEKPLEERGTVMKLEMPEGKNPGWLESHYMGNMLYVLTNGNYSGGLDPSKFRSPIESHTPVSITNTANHSNWWTKEVELSITTYTGGNCTNFVISSSSNLFFKRKE
jgi:hypothetical protein